MTRNVFATITHDEHKDVLLNQKCVRYSMNRIQSKNHRIETYEINKYNYLVLMTEYIFKAMDIPD